jgi:DNA-binding PadR family transcriptional regulator
VGLRPPRKTYVLSSAGEALVHEWLRRPVERMREGRLEFLLKLFFLNLTDQPAVKQLLAEQIRVCEAYLAHIRQSRDESPFRRLVARSKTSAAEATLGWLNSYVGEIEDAP